MMANYNTRPAFPFGSGRLRQYRPGELPGLRYGETRPPGSLAAGALPQVNEDPRGGMTGVAQGEPAYREIPPATGAQVLVVSVRADPCNCIWPHHAPPGYRVTTDSDHIYPYGYRQIPGRDYSGLCRAR